jgi:hypothetical protein
MQLSNYPPSHGPIQHFVHEIPNSAAFLRRVSTATPFVLIIKPSSDFLLASFLDEAVLECDIHVANATELPELPLMLQTYSLPEAVGFDNTGQVLTRAHLNVMQYDAHHTNANIVNRLHACLQHTTNMSD